MVSQTLISALALAATASAHMIMLTPTPFNNATIDNSPLESTGANFPCKSTGQSDFYNAAGISNSFPAGSTQQLSFRGSAVHGGGSCQLAITTDKAPTASTSWQVILSIEGGCPSKDGNSPSTYDYQIPSSVAPGDYVFAWTWVSKLAGQPEYYMNCAPITITGGSKKVRDAPAMTKRDTSSLPELAVFNLASINDCKTTPGTDPQYPNPGPALQTPGTSPKYAPLTGNCVPKGQTQAGGSSGSGGSASGAPSSGGPVPTSSPAGGAGGAPSSAAATSAAASTYGAGAGGAPSSSAAAAPTSALPTYGSGSGATGGASSAAAPTETPSPTVGGSGGYGSGSSTAAATSAAAQTSDDSDSMPTETPSPTMGGSGGYGSGSATTAFSPPMGPGSSSTGGAGSVSGACSTEGMWNCIGGTSYQRCAAGQWTAVQALASGQSCTPGQSMTLWRRGRSVARDVVRRS